MQSGWQRKQQRKRNLIAWGVAVGAVLAVFVGWLLVEALGLTDVTSYSGPILVKLGSPDGQDLPDVAQEPAPQPETQPEQQPAPTTEPDTRPEQPAPQPDQSNTLPAPPSPSPEPSIAPSPRPSVKPSAKPSPRPSTAPRASAAPAPSLTPIASPKASAAPGPVLVKGQEYGNSHELSSNESSGRMGRSLYVPINYYMPLPSFLDGTMYDRIASKGNQSLERRQEIFKSVYRKDGSQWRLDGQPDLGQRPRLWEILQDSGYDISKADYKRVVRADVVLTFTLGAPVNGKPTLKDLKVLQSSGSGDVDEAVKFGFQQSTYFNDTGHDVSGRFTYRFD